MKSCALILMLAVGCGRRTAQEEAAIGAEIRAVAERLAGGDQFSGVVLVSRHGHPLLRQAYGMADREAGRANTPDTRFALASVSKMFTAVMVAQLVEQGVVRFESTVGSVLPEYPNERVGSQVTLHHLLTMSSGIPDVFRLPKFWEGIARVRTLPDFWQFFASEALEFAPGEKWEYSNSNFLVLGSVVERAVGARFAAAAEQRVFGPAGMTRTTYRLERAGDAARGYTHVQPGNPPGSAPDGSRWYRAWEDGGSDDASVAGASMGGGFSTADDLARFAEALMEGRLVRRETADRMMTGYVPAEYGGRHGYGLETRVVNGVRVFGHRGGFAGISNQVDFYPDLGYVVVVLGNSDADGALEIASKAREAIARR